MNQSTAAQQQKAAQPVAGGIAAECTASGLSSGIGAAIDGLCAEVSTLEKTLEPYLAQLAQHGERTEGATEFPKLPTALAFQEMNRRRIMALSNTLDSLINRLRL